MSKLVIGIIFDEEIPENEKYEVESHLSGLISEEFICYGEEYPGTDIKSFWKDNE